MFFNQTSHRQRNDDLDGNQLVIFYLSQVFASCRKKWILCVNLTGEKKSHRKGYFFLLLATFQLFVSKIPRLSEFLTDSIIFSEGS